MNIIKNEMFIWGAGGQGRVVLDILKKDNNVDIIGFIDSDKKIKGKLIRGVKVLGDEKVLNELRRKGINTGIVAIGDNKIRSEIASYLSKKNFLLTNAIHSSAIISSTAKIGKNVTICAGAIICTDSIIRNNAIINTGSIVEHDNVIKNGAHIASGVQLGGRVIVGERVLVGVGATILPYKNVGKNSIIGAGSVVIDNIPSNVISVGIPARIKKQII